MSGELLLVRERFDLDDRAYTVMADPTFNGAKGMWQATLVFLSLDRSFSAPLTSAPVSSAVRRDDLLAAIGQIEDKEIADALRAIELPLPKIRTNKKRGR
ncbi:MAG TPA: hypothetical protein VJ650_13465 [Gemmatimonadaceae bacterium]|nr:hypothetical protein [Gemmatimonadaceae bacterium]